MLLVSQLHILWWWTWLPWLWICMKFRLATCNLPLNGCYACRPCYVAVSAPAETNISEEEEGGIWGVSLVMQQVTAQVRGASSAIKLGPADIWLSWHKSGRAKTLVRYSLHITKATHHGSATMSTQTHIQAAKSLPPQLLRFFRKYPPPALFPNLTSASIPTARPSQDPETISSTPPGDAGGSISEISVPSAKLIPSTAPRNSRIPSHAHDLPYPNPFLPSKNFTTGRWRGPAYGLRKQADLVKLASQCGVVDLLPWSVKKPGEKEARRIDRGLQVKGTGEGQKVKGKSWERTLKGRLEMRRQAMLNMPALIQEWKQKGHGRGWKKWPSGKAR